MKKLLHRERTLEISRGSGTRIELNTDQCMHVSELPKVEEDTVLRCHLRC